MSLFGMNTVDFFLGGAAEEKRRVGPHSHMQEVVVDFRAESLSSSELLK